MSAAMRGDDRTDLRDRRGVGGVPVEFVHGDQFAPGQHGQVDIFSLGPDGVPESNDDIGNWTIGKK